MAASDMFLVIWRDLEEPLISLRDEKEVIELLASIADPTYAQDVQWIYNPEAIEDNWFYERLSDWPEHTGIIVRLKLVKPVPVTVTTHFKLE